MNPFYPMISIFSAIAIVYGGFLVIDWLSKRSQSHDMTENPQSVECPIKWARDAARLRRYRESLWAIRERERLRWQDERRKAQ